MMKRTCFHFVLAFVFLVCGELAHAQFYTGPVSSATGGAGRAAVDPSEAGILNPASIAHLQTYNVSGSYGYGHHERDGDFNQFGILLADGTPGNMFPGAFSYVHRYLSPKAGTSDTQGDIQIAAAGFAFPNFALGIAAHRQTDKLGTGEEFTQLNGHVGIIYTPYDFLGLGAVAYDVLPAGDSVPVGVRVVPTFGIGANVLVQKILHVRLDLVRPDKYNENHRTNVMAGLETYFREDVAFRVGGLWKETANETYLTTGLGYRGPRLSFDYTFQKDVRVADSYRHLFDLWLPF